MVSSRFRGGAGGENFPLFLYSNISSILQVDLFTVGVQMFLVHAFLLKGDEATLPNKLGFTEFHFHANFLKFRDFPP